MRGTRADFGDRVGKRVLIEKAESIDTFRANLQELQSPISIKTGEPENFWLWLHAVLIQSEQHQHH